MKRPTAPKIGVKKPVEPVPPSEFIEDKQIFYISPLTSYSCDEEISIEDLLDRFPPNVPLEQCKLYMHSTGHGYYDEQPSFYVRGVCYSKIPNPRFAELTVRHKANIVKYEKELEAYIQAKEIYNVAHEKYIIELEAWKAITSEQKLKRLIQEVEAFKKIFG